MFRWINSADFLSKCKKLKWIVSQDDDVYVRYNMVGPNFWHRNFSFKIGFVEYFFSRKTFGESKFSTIKIFDEKFRCHIFCTCHQIFSLKTNSWRQILLMFIVFCIQMASKTCGRFPFARKRIRWAFPTILLVINFLLGVMAPESDLAPTQVRQFTHLLFRVTGLWHRKS